MSRMRRIGSIFLSLVMIAFGVLLLCSPNEGLVIVALGLALWLLASGVRKLVYFFTMARHMVGGLSMLFIAVIMIDISGFVFLFIGEPKLSIVVFLVGYNAYMALTGLVHVVESKLLESRWAASLFHSIVNLVLAVASIVFFNSDEVVIAIFCIWLFYAAGVRLVSAIRPTEIIYIQ